MLDVEAKANSIRGSSGSSPAKMFFRFFVLAGTHNENSLNPTEKSDLQWTDGGERLGP